MRVVSLIVEAPSTAWTASTSSPDVVQAVAVPQDELMHVYAGVRPRGFGVVVFLLVPLDQAAATGCRLVLTAADALGEGWSLGTVRVWGPEGLS